MNESWVDLESGELITVTDTAVPLRDILLNEDLEVPADKYERPGEEKYNQEHVLAVGRLMVDALRDEISQEQIPLTEEHMERMYALGLLPDINFIKRQFGTFSEFRRRIEAARPRASSEYDTMESAQVFNRIFEVHQQYGEEGPLTLQALNLYHQFGLLPSYHYLYNRFGGIQKLNDYLGYPDIRSWEMTDYLFYGASVLEENGSDSLTIKNARILSGLKFGPDPQAIKRRFGSWEVYRRLSREEYEHQQHEKEAKRQVVDQHFADVPYGENAPRNETDRRRCWAQYHVAFDCNHRLSADELRDLSLLPTDEFLPALQQTKKDLTVNDIEMTAVTLHMSDDIWPPLYRRKPKLPVQQ